MKIVNLNKESKTSLLRIATGNTVVLMHNHTAVINKASGSQTISQSKLWRSGNAQAIIIHCKTHHCTCNEQNTAHGKRQGAMIQTKLKKFEKIESNH